MMGNTQKTSPKPGNSASAATESTALDVSLLSKVSASIESRMGLHFPKERQRDLERHIRSAAKELGYKDAGTFVEWLLSSPLSRGRIETLARHLAVGETYFFRDMGSFDTLNEDILPGLILSRKGKDQRLRIWSVGCSTGEEAYSIAIALDRLIPDLKEWAITILATDINPDFLDAAREGIYREWSFRGAPQWVKHRYFARTEKGFEILPRIKRMVTFSYHNLIDDPYPSVAHNTSAMDIVFCRNVLMYFSRKRAREVIQRLSGCILEGGWLAISPVEASPAITPLFEGVRFREALLYKKKGEGGETVKGRSGASKKAPIEAASKVKEEESRDGEPKRGKGPAAASPFHRTAGPPHGVVSPAPRLPDSPPRDTGSLSALAREAADRGRLSEAIALCEKAIDGDKLNASLYYLKATVLLEADQAGEAAVCLRQAIYIDQDFVLAHFAYAHLMQRQERHREARTHFKAAGALLTKYGQEEILPESGGISAGRLMEIIMETTGAIS